MRRARGPVAGRFLNAQAPANARRLDLHHHFGSPRWIRRAVEDSLRRLDTDHIDLYQMHRPDYDADLDETLVPAM